MCVYSQEFASRRAQYGDALKITRINYGMGDRMVVGLKSPESNIVCVCLKTGDWLEFRGLPESFQIEHQVGLNALAQFFEHQEGLNTYRDSFGFGINNANKVNISYMPAGVELIPYELVGVERSAAVAVSEVDPSPFLAPGPSGDGEPVLVTVSRQGVVPPVHRRTSNGNRIALVVMVALVVTAVAASQFLG